MDWGWADTAFYLLITFAVLVLIGAALGLVAGIAYRVMMWLGVK